MLFGNLCGTITSKQRTSFKLLPIFHSGCCEEMHIISSDNHHLFRVVMISSTPAETPK